ncbi:uncharacterized protein EAF01_007347 [Botrytis porri]|uniref:uncharacterized protein n=1 Tax=Botrytis porri TaxID=87229 RepID=UPI0019006DCC|nr:uncharacterized protein EAF01_007347 [Botrytis porri]KAF7902049.1 hypothetical protein EAF01_007347 [Botrytis porri]
MSNPPALLTLPVEIRQNSSTTPSIQKLLQSSISNQIIVFKLLDPKYPNGRRFPRKSMSTSTAPKS